MLAKLEQKVADFIVAEGLLSPDENILLAVSGGADSTALLRIMVSLRTAGVLPVEICCAHINHQLRGAEAQRDQDFVVEQCRKLGVPVVTEQVDVRRYARAEKLSIETAARELRIDSLLKIAARQNCTCIVTAHQENDNAETILHRLVRGTGFRGLCGIWPAKTFAGGARFVRPLLCADRDAILKYLGERKLRWCEDRTNADCSYRRNFIRNRILPAIQKDCKESIVEQIAAMANVSRRFYRRICAMSDAIWQNVAVAEEQTVALDLGKLNAQQAEVKVEVVRRAIARLDGGEQEITEQHYRDILRLSKNKTIELPRKIRVYRDREKIVFVRSPKARTTETDLAEPVALKIPGVTAFANVQITAETFKYDAVKFAEFKANKSNDIEWLDFESIRQPLIVRRRRRGDKFWPLGLASEKRVGKFLTSAKTSLTIRRKLLVIADSEKIIWLWPVRISEQVKVSKKTKNILQLRIADTL